MTEYPSTHQNEHPVPTLREMLAGYALYNVWEKQEQAATLPHLSIEESLRRYFELCAVTTEMAGEDDDVFLEQNERHWTILQQRLEKLQSVAKNGKTTPGPG